jgi:hypothetical protein
MPTRRLALMLIIGILLAVVIGSFFMKPSEPKVVEQGMRQVVVAKRIIPPYTVLNAGTDLMTRTVPLNDAGYAFSSPAELDGWFTIKELPTNGVIRSSDVLKLDANWVAGDMLIFSFYVATDRVVGGQVRPGHHVDLLVTHPETNVEFARSLWLARNLWVVDVRQVSGSTVPRPTLVPEGQTQEKRATGGGLLEPASAETTYTSREGPSNLVVVAAPREVAKMVGEYLGARLYDAWLYIRPEGLNVVSGRIEGVVFEEQKNIGIRDREERGLDGVTVSVRNQAGESKGTLQTFSGGQFYFDDLAPGTYTVELGTVAGYTPVTPPKVTLNLAAGQNAHLLFGLQGAGAATAVPQQAATATPIPATPAPARPTATPAAGQPTATPAGPVVPPKICSCSIRMSDRENGAEVTDFPEHTKEVWAILTFQDCPAEMPYTVRAYFAGTGNQERVVGAGKWQGGSGTVSLKVTPWAATEFQPGAYLTFLKVGPENVVCDFRWWFVDVVRTAQGTIEYPRTMPVTGFGFGSE